MAGVRKQFPCKFYVYNSFLLGVVRGINISKDELYLITPESDKILGEVDFITCESVSLPPSLYMTSDDVYDLVPYVSAGVLSSFSAIPKRTHLPKRLKNVTNI